MKVFALLTMLVVVWCQPAYASLLLSPTRLVIKDKERTGQIALINDSDEPQTYRLSFEEKRITEDGNLVNLTDEEATAFSTASGMLRVTPRTVSLKPRERQIVKIAVRRPANLVPGDYRSHLLLTATPPPPSQAGPVDGQMAMFRFLTSFSMPIVVQHGAEDARVQVLAARVNPLGSDKAYTISLERQGRSTLIGNVTLYKLPYRPDDKPVARLNDMPLYPEQNKRLIGLINLDSTVLNKGSRVLVRVEGNGEKIGQVLAEKELVLQ